MNYDKRIICFLEHFEIQYILNKLVELYIDTFALHQNIGEVARSEVRIQINKKIYILLFI